jgi:hypothetical protein
MYKLMKTVYSDSIVSVFNSESGASIPFDPANTDAIEFAKWLQEGGRPEPAEEGGTVTDEWIAETIAKLLP